MNTILSCNFIYFKNYKFIIIMLKIFNIKLRVQKNINLAVFINLMEINIFLFAL